LDASRAQCEAKAVPAFEDIGFDRLGSDGGRPNCDVIAIQKEV